MLFSIRRVLGIAAVTVAAAAPLCGQGAAPAPAPAPAPSPITVTGLVYTQFLYQLADTSYGVSRFDITRAYINILGKWSGGLQARITGDIFTNSDSSRAYRLKYAYAAYTPAKSPLTFKAGLIHTPWLDWEEALWDYRMQGAMAMDRDGYLSSADFGIGIDEKTGSDVTNGQITIVNGENYNKGTGDDGKDIMARFSVRVLESDDKSRVGGLRVSVYGQWGVPTSGGQRERAIMMLSYRSKIFTVAAEAAATRDTVSGTAVVAGVYPTAIAVQHPTNGHVYSAYGVFHIPQAKGKPGNAAIIARVDIQKPNSGGVNTQTTRYIAGVSYQLHPNWRLLADVDLLSYQTTPTAAQVLTQKTAYFQTQINF